MRKRREPKWKRAVGKAVRAVGLADRASVMVDTGTPNTFSYVCDETQRTIVFEDRARTAGELVQDVQEQVVVIPDTGWAGMFAPTSPGAVRTGSNLVCTITGFYNLISTPTGREIIRRGTGYVGDASRVIVSAEEYAPAFG